MATTIQDTLPPGFTPGLAPPQGVQPDPYSPETINLVVIIAESICLGSVTILMFIRCGVRIFLMKQWATEDWLSLVAFVGFVAYSAIIAFGVTIGAGDHQWDVDKEAVKQILYYNNIEEVIYGPTIVSIKICLLLMYQRIFAPARYSRRWWAIAAVIVLNLSFYVPLTFAKIFLCRPREAIWDKSIKGAKCGNLEGVLIASGTWNTLSDLVILAMPLMFVWQLKLAREKRLSLAAVFAVGSIAPIFSVIGIAMRVRFTASPDTTYGQWRILLFALAELTAGLICTCLPVLPRLQKWLKLKIKGVRSGSGSYAYDSYGNRSGDHFKKRSVFNHSPGGGDDTPKGESYVELTETGGSSANPNGDRRRTSDDSDENYITRNMTGSNQPFSYPNRQTSAFVTTEGRSDSVPRSTFGHLGRSKACGILGTKQPPAESAILKTTDITVVHDEARTHFDDRASDSSSDKQTLHVATGSVV